MSRSFGSDKYAVEVLQHMPSNGLASGRIKTRHDYGSIEELRQYRCHSIRPESDMQQYSIKNRRQIVFPLAAKTMKQVWDAPNRSIYDSLNPRLLSERLLAIL
jgi:hypothetical protein